jgi:c-di-GMP phosphodiesterase
MDETEILMIVSRPIYNQQLQRVAFEILYSSKDPLNQELSSDLLQIISANDTDLPLFIPFGLKRFIEYLKTPNPIILKVLAEEVETLYSLDELRDSSFSIALVINSPPQLTWINCAEYVALTEQLINQANMSKVVQYTKENLRKVMAYGLTKPFTFNKCKNLAIDYYCGDFLFKTSIEEPLEIATNKFNLLQLIQSVQKEDCDLKTMAVLIQSDPLLSYQLLRLANSAAFSAGNPISSIEQAVTRLGTVQLKNWIVLFSMHNISNKPVEILESGLIRARMAQEIAKKHASINDQSAYTAGLLSVLDCLLNKPIEELISSITLSEEVTDALVSRSGDLGEILSTIIAYESGHWESVGQDTVNGLDLSKLYIDSLSILSNDLGIY